VCSSAAAADWKRLDDVQPAQAISKECRGHIILVIIVVIVIIVFLLFLLFVIIVIIIIILLFTRGQ
jgi:Flp pilus assembly protein TadB